MSRKRKFKTASIRVALPVLSGSILRAGHPVTVLANEDPRSTRRPPGYAIPVPYELAPSFLSDFLHIEDISNDECRRLGELLGADLSESVRIDFCLLVQRFVAGVALADRLPSWQDYARRLKDIIAAHDLLIDSAQRFKELVFWELNDDSSKVGIISLDVSVKHYISLSEAKPKIDYDLSTTRDLCANALERIQPLASKRGKKEDMNFYLFMQSLFYLARDAGAEITLPSGQIKEKYSLPDRPPFFSFVKEALHLAKRKGRAAIEQADLPAPEKAAALKRLDESAKTDGGILEYLRKARKGAAVPTNKASPSDQSVSK